MDRKARMAALGSVPLFERLSKSELRGLLDQMEEESFSPGTEMVREGAKGGRFYVIVEGRASVVVGSTVAETIGPGSYFGEMSVIDGQPRAASVRAETYVKALSLTSWNFLALLQENWTVSRKVISDLCRRVRELDKSLTH